MCAGIGVVVGRPIKAIVRPTLLPTHKCSKGRQNLLALKRAETSQLPGVSRSLEKLLLNFLVLLIP